jgi:hypothetical protein
VCQVPCEHAAILFPERPNLQGSEARSGMRETLRSTGASDDLFLNVEIFVVRTGRDDAGVFVASRIDRSLNFNPSAAKRSMLGVS